MNKTLPIICLFVLIFIPFNYNAAASDVVIKGSSQFDCSLSEKFMKKHGYFFIEESSYETYISTNIYAASGSELSVLDEEGNVLGTAMADNEGSFSITVPKGETYRIIARFHDQKVEKVVKFSDIEKVTVSLGFFKSEIVDNWLRTAS